MLGFDYCKFREAVQAAKLQKYEELKNDIDKTKAFLEKMLTLILDSNANTARSTYLGIDL
jgi:hypothetical protein